MKGKPIYITSTLPYVNASPHVGFALEIVHADLLARYYESKGADVFLNTGTDEHGQKVFEAAAKAGMVPQAYVNQYAEKFKGLKSLLGLSENVHFIRTSDPKHKDAAIEFWKRCFAAGDIYKKKYQTKYCVGCELEKTDSELSDGHCLIHPNLKIELRDEENYFFRFSKYQKPLLELYEKRPDFVVPNFRFNEIKAFVFRGLEDFSISRLKSKMSWGVPVPGDEEHVMYVWFDALVSYISTIGWPKDMTSFETWWTESGGVVQFAGKDQVRMQAAMWQAMLLSAGLSHSRQIVIHGFITSGGQKMSKSLGNVIDPYDIVKEYGTDALRYYLVREMNPFEDGDFTMEKFKAAYNGNLANGIGNLVSRVIKMASNASLKVPGVTIEGDESVKLWSAFIQNYEFNKAADVAWSRIQDADVFIQKTEPFKVLKTEPEKAKKDLIFLLGELKIIAHMLTPILPDTAKKIEICLQTGTMPVESLFPRKS